MPEPEPEAIEEGLSADALKEMLEAMQSEMFEMKKELKQCKKEKKKVAAQLEDAEDEIDDLTEAAENDANQYRLKEENPQNYGKPRMWYFGLRMSC